MQCYNVAFNHYKSRLSLVVVCKKGFDMDTAVVSGRPPESVLTNPGGRRRPSQAEAEAALRTLIEWAGDSPDREGLALLPKFDAGAGVSYPQRREDRAVISTS